MDTLQIRWPKGKLESVTVTTQDKCQPNIGHLSLPTVLEMGVEPRNYQASIFTKGSKWGSEAYDPMVSEMPLIYLKSSSLPVWILESRCMEALIVPPGWSVP